MTAVFAVAQTYGTHHKSASDPRINSDAVTNTNLMNGNAVTTVGATSVPSMATTTYDEININTNGPFRGFDTGADGLQSDESPIGEPAVLLLFAAVFAGVVTYRKRVAAK